MDLHLIPGAVPTEDERAAIDAALAQPAHEPAAVRGPVPLRHRLLPALHAAHARIGWISEGALNHICERLSLPPAEAYGVASFYAMLSTSPRPPKVLHVCDDIACRTYGAEALCSTLERTVGQPGQPTAGGSATWLRSPCLGQCDRGPNVLCQRAGRNLAEWTIDHATADAVKATLTSPDDGIPPREAPQVFADPVRLLRRVGRANPASLEAYRAHGGGRALRRALSMTPADIIREVADAGLVGRGGALFPTSRKWEAVARASATPHYLVCNGDESEPGTFKDRVLMEEDPFALLEAMTIVAYATGCEQGYIYTRKEYPLAAERIATAIAESRAQGLLGDAIDIDGTRMRFDVELRRGAGAYICGEETALFNSIEGFRGEPRNKPPFPVESGLFGKPTVVHNVETLAHVVEILAGGAVAFKEVGTPRSTGTKLFCVSGCVTRPGLYEVPFGTPLRALVERAGGVRGGRPLQAILLGGAAGVFVGPKDLNMPLSIEGASAIAATIGSGVVMLFDDRVDLKDIVMRITRFFRDESCGQCVPCRIGTMRQEEIVHSLATATARVTDGLALVDDLARVMRDASICGLGQTAASAVQSAIRLGVFP